MSENNPIRVFVTHNFAESYDYLRVFEFLESVDRFYYLNVARPENVPAQGGLDAIKEELIQQIKQAEAVIVVADVHERQPDLVSFIMDVAEANELGMIAVKPYGGVREIDPEVAERVQEHVEWNDRELVDALRRQARGEDTARWEVVEFPGWNADGEVEDDNNQ